MGFLGKLFKKEGAETKTPRGFYQVSIAQVNRLTPDAVEIVFEIPQDIKGEFSFIPGQYITVCLTIDGKEERRSYSICSAKNKALAIAVKEVEKGKVSTWFNRSATAGSSILISKPEGRFLLNGAKNVIAVAAGSGITPIMSMAHEMNAIGGKMTLLYANKTEGDILFRNELDQIDALTKRYHLTKEEKAGFEKGRITKDAFISFIKEDLAVLKSDGFYICGPEEMVLGIKSALEMFGVAETKIHFELFTTSTESKKETEVKSTGEFKGKSKVKVIVDDETHTFEMNSSKTILDAAIADDIDAPYSCRGGVCSTCRAKVLSGTVKMNLNYTLTDKEVEQGYILTCQSYPTSEELTISFDE